MRNYVIVLFVLIFVNTVSANTGLLVELKNDKRNVALIAIDCDALYNSTLKFMKSRYPESVAIFTAEQTRTACYDENEASSGTNPDCKPKVKGIKSN